MNDLNRHIHLGACNLYADDTLVYCAANSIDKLQEGIQECVTEIEEWYTKNRLVINVLKLKHNGSLHKTTGDTY